MALFKWKDSYSCKIARIDAQHKKLFELGSKLTELLSLKDEYDHYDEIIKALKEMVDYTKYHFKTEEELMKKYGYDNVALVAHKKEHQQFIDKVAQMVSKDIDADQQGFLLELVDFICEWIVNHILKTDKQYEEFFQSCGLS